MQALRLNFSGPADKAQHDQMVRLVESMLGAKKQLTMAQANKDKAYYEKKYAALDGEIDRLVYDLYGLTEEEISMVEGSAKT